MATLPELSSGARIQYPAESQLRFQTVECTLRGGRRMIWRDPGGGLQRWRLHYAELDGAEKGALIQLFSTCEGRLRTFILADPMANLLVWTEDLGREEWQKGPFVITEGGRPDPLNGTRATNILNQGGSPAEVSQSLTTASGTYCFSAWGRSATGGTMDLVLRGGLGESRRGSLELTDRWMRFSVTGQPGITGSTITASIVFPAGANIEVFGPQLETQPSAGPYRRNDGRRAVHLAARFDADELTFRETESGRFSIIVPLIAPLAD